MKGFFFWRRREQAVRGTPAPRPNTESGKDLASASTILTGNAREDSRSLEILLDTIAAVTANIDLDTVLHDIVDRSLQVTRAERALLFLGDSAATLEVRVAQDPNGKAMAKDQPFSKSVVRRCLEEGMPQRSVVQSDQEALELGQSVYDLKLRAVMCAPLVARNRTVGVIYVDSRAQRREFSERDLALFGAISAQLAISLENARLYSDSLAKVRLEKDVEIARRIQQHLLPTVPKQHPGVGLALRYVAADTASGDTYDFVPLKDGRIAVMIGDVTGHGVGAALLTHAAQAALRSYLELIDDLSEVVTRLNNRLVASVETGIFMSLLLCIIDPRRRTLQYVNAGHPSLIHCGRNGVRALEKTGMVLGVESGQHYAVSPIVHIEDGDLLFLHTDGVDEAMSPGREVYGETRLHRELARVQALPAEGVLAALEEKLRQHTGSVFGDDFTMIAVKLDGTTLAARSGVHP
jgi:serine phosphatase RsbU (regulator of sigma subunit)